MPASEENVHNRATLPKSEKWRIIKNVLVLGLAFMVHFTAFHGTANLQSSVNADSSIGTLTLASIYGSLILSNIFLPAAVIRWLGCKWTIALSFIAYMPFILAQFKPKIWTMIPAGLAVGLGGGPLWCAKCTYLSLVSEVYSEITGENSDVLVVRFFGLFFMFYQLAQVWGNLISSSILSSSLGMDQPSHITTVKQTMNASNSINIDKIMETCGAKFCFGENIEEMNPNLESPPTYKINIITAIYLVCMILAVLAVALGVDPLKRYNTKQSNPGVSGVKLLSVTLKHLRHKNQILLLPVTLFIGAEQAFMAADFTSAYVGCAWGIQNIGYVLICFGVMNAIAAPVAGSIVKLTGRFPVMIVALLLHLGVMSTLLAWKPSPEESYMFFVIAALWGTADAVWLVQVNALSGILFPGKEEASYSNFRLWEATGSVIAYISSPYLCTALKLYVLIGILLIGMACYSYIEFNFWMRTKRNNIRESVVVRQDEIVALRQDEVNFKNN